MNISKKFDRAFQWAGEKMGTESKTTMSEEFKMLEAEMALRLDGTERLQRSMSQYVKWMGKRLESSEDKAYPIGYLGHMMVSHGEEFHPDSDFGNCLIAMGRANERISAIQESFVSEATSSWLESLERSLAMMKDYQAARKKLESRRLAYDASISRLQKSKKDDFKLEEELRSAKAKYDEASEDVSRRMQDIQSAEVDSIRDLSRFLDAELDYHERCALELRRLRQHWPSVSNTGSSPGEELLVNYSRSQSRPTRIIRSNTYSGTSKDIESVAPPVRMPTRPGASQIRIQLPQVDGPGPSIVPSKTSSFLGEVNLDREGERQQGFQGFSRTSLPTPTTTSTSNLPSVSNLRGQLRRVNLSQTANQIGRDDDVTSISDSGSSPTSNDRQASNIGARTATTSESLSLMPSGRTPGQLARPADNAAASPFANESTIRKTPPPPPPSRSKKPTPPVPPKRRDLGA